MGDTVLETREQPALRSAEAAQRLVLDIVHEHAESLLGVARRHSLCLDDAHDAYQRGIEILLRHAARLDRDGAPRWTHTVVKHEAMRLRASRLRIVGNEEVDLDAHEAGQLPDAQERVLAFDRMTRAAEAMQRLKPQEVRALWLRAQGLSYEEIAEACDWTYTKVNPDFHPPTAREPSAFAAKVNQPSRQSQTLSRATPVVGGASRRRYRVDRQKVCVWLRGNNARMDETVRWISQGPTMICMGGGSSNGGQG
jgi:RNA polymerase sigma factor (sigma-70 family)